MIDHVAAHEAGHAVVYLALTGYPAAHLDIVSALAVPTLGQAGRMRHAPTDDPYQEAVISLAGCEAGRAAGYSAAWAGGAGDVAAAIADLWGTSDVDPVHGLGAILADVAARLEAVQRAARAAVANFWPEITAGAAALESAEFRTLSGVEFARAAGGRVAWYAEAGAGAGLPTESAADYHILTDCRCGRPIVVPDLAAAGLGQAMRQAWIERLHDGS